MKTAVSIPDALFEAADQLAARRGVSRSELYAQALAHIIATEGDDAVTERLDTLYSAEISALDPVLKSVQRRRTLSSEW
jgi:metal-responsive CopG/Arc/MetJ family transcriptional regulator